MSDYWAERQAKTQTNLTNKSIKETEKQLAKYYKGAMTKVISDFESVYDKILVAVEDGKEPTPADLYKLDKYWKMQGQLRQELQRLGDKQAKLLSKQFVEEYKVIYEATAIKGSPAFAKADLEIAKQIVNEIWVADGQSWSTRIWKNTSKLGETLNEELIHCLISGKKTSELKDTLIKRFNVSYSNADSLVRTEMAHIQTQAARQRYLDYGVTEVEILVDPDERTCPICGKLDRKRYPINGKMPVPAHPRCRCCIMPVIEYKNNS